MSPDASWTFSPGAIVLILAATGVYVVRWRRAGASVGRLALFGAGMACVAAAIVSPLDRLAEQLLSMHMVQHLLLLDLAPILIILGFTKVLLRPATRRLMPLEKAAGFLAHPAFAVALYAGAMWVWHIPALYDAALENPALHVFEHLVMSAAGGLYWWHVLSPIRPRVPLVGLGGAAYMLSTKVLLGILGIVLTFAPESFYAFYEGQPRYWDLSAQEDQALGGAIMAIEQSIVMGIALAYLFVRLLSDSEKEEERAERYAAAAEEEDRAERYASP
ncbi:MAG TPA: cytochrome c oxidase assembly protein [Solirubrobacteraceae bacterium]|nr:cytochrome c oxidase assembly protein [Solirubrobacteraceae bacterium]